MHFGKEGLLIIAFAIATGFIVSGCESSDNGPGSGGKEPSPKPECPPNKEFGTFPQSLDTRLVSGSAKKSYLLEDYSFNSTKGMIWTAKKNTSPNGWTWNGSSIPWVFTALFGTPKIGCHVPASVLHDFYYQTADNHKHERRQVDEMYYQAVRANGVGLVKAKTMYFALRVGGGRAFKRTNSKIDEKWDLEALERPQQRALVERAAEYIEQRDPELGGLEPKNLLHAVAAEREEYSAGVMSTDVKSADVSAESVEMTELELLLLQVVQQ